MYHRHISHVFQSGFLAPSKIRLHEVIFRHPLRFPNVIIPAKTHDTTLISTVLLPSRSDWSHTHKHLHSSLIPLDSHAVSTANFTTPDGERVIEYVKENVCDSDWSIYWVIALGFVPLRISGWVYLALISSAITEDGNKQQVLRRFIKTRSVL